MRRPSLRPTVADTVSKALIKRLGDAQTGHTWVREFVHFLFALFSLACGHGGPGAPLPVRQPSSRQVREGRRSMCISAPPLPLVHLLPAKSDKRAPPPPLAHLLPAKSDKGE
jgi:hypothetical protein